MTVTDHSFEIHNAQLWCNVRFVIGICDLAPASLGTAVRKQLALHDSAKVTPYVWQTTGKEVRASLFISNIAFPSEPNQAALILAAMVRHI